MSPRVSVGMPAYNAAAFIATAIDSLLAQTQPDFELLIVDDGSTDETCTIVEAYCCRDARIHLLRQPHTGVSAARNMALDAAHSRYLAWLDADDRAHPDRLARQVAAFDADPGLLILGSAYRLIDAQGNFQAVHGLPETDSGIRWQCLFHSPFAQSAVMLRLEAVRRTGLRYDPNIHTGVEDFDLWSRMLAYGRGRNLRQPLVDYRLHANQLSQPAGDAHWNAATAVAQRNIERLGQRLPLETVSVLRRWFYAFPARLAPADAAPALALGDILNRFAAQPGLDRREGRRIRGRWALKLLAAARTLDPAAQREIVRRLGLAGLLAAAAYAPGRLLRGPVSYPEHTDEAG